MKIKRLQLSLVVAAVLLFLPACSNDYNYEPPEGSRETAITHVSFGKMVIDGKERMGDLVIQPGGEVRSWLFDNDTHLITVDNITRIVSENTKVLIVGVGYNGQASLGEKAKKYVEKLKNTGIEVHVLPTTEAAAKFNTLPKATMAAMFHLNC